MTHNLYSTLYTILRHFVPFDILSFDILSHSTFCPFDILYHLIFCHSAFCPIRRSVVRRFVLSAFVTSTFCRWTVSSTPGWSLATTGWVSMTPGWASRQENCYLTNSKLKFSKPRKCKLLKVLTFLKAEKISCWESYELVNSQKK
jgi:hypothetical protein